MTEPTEWRYRPTLRPAMGGGIPRGVGWDYVETPSDGSVDKRPDLPRSRHRYGVLRTDRQLTECECKHFDLVEVIVVPPAPAPIDWGEGKP